MAPPILAAEQINCGPDWTDARDSGDRWISLQTPVGEYSIAPILARLPLEQWPDVLVCLADSSRRNLPRDLKSFHGPKVLLLADTHHLQAPLTTLMRYAAAERFDRIVFLYGRHHAPLFAAAGFQNLFWFPGLTFPHRDAAVRAAISGAKAQPRIMFVGQSGKFHPRRARLLAEIGDAGLPVLVQQAPQVRALRCYAESAVGFNCSLNGDLNLRCFEIMASGALLLTDELGAGAGMAELREHGCDFLTFRSPGEMIDLAAQALRSPEEARRRGAAGRAWFESTLNESRRLSVFRALAMEGIAPQDFPLFSAGAAPLSFSSQRDLLGQTMLYEAVQELHRTKERVWVQVTSCVPESFRSLCATLPRVVLAEPDSVVPPDLLVTSVAALVEAPNPTATSVWCYDAVPQQFADLAVVMEAAGFVPASEKVAVYRRKSPAATPPVSAGAPAERF